MVAQRWHCVSLPVKIQHPSVLLNTHLNRARFPFCFVLLFRLSTISQILSCFHDAKSWRKESDKNPGHSGCITPPAANPNRRITSNGPHSRPTTSPSRTRAWKEVHHFLNFGAHRQEKSIDATKPASPGDYAVAEHYRFGPDSPRRISLGYFQKVLRL
jgi:hypothetical protein